MCSKIHFENLIQNESDHVPLDSSNVLNSLSDENVSIENIFAEIYRLQKDNLEEKPQTFNNKNIEEIISEVETLVSKSSKTINRSATDEDIQEKGKRKLLESIAAVNKIDSFTMNSNSSKSLPVAKASHQNSIFDMKKSLNKMTGNIAKDFSPRNNTDSGIAGGDTKDSKLLISLQEELKDTTERLKSLQLQHENLIESSRLMKNSSDDLFKYNKSLESKLFERDSVLGKLKKEIELLKTYKSQFDSNEEKLTKEVTCLKEEKRSLVLQTNKDKIAIQDLQRQCKEMEGILSRRHPDSVSALIVASKNPVHENTKELLEKRISFLEKELKEQELKYQKSLSLVQDKVNGMKENYETHISDLEKQVVNLQVINSEIKDLGKHKSTQEMYSQTDPPIQTQVVKPSSGKSVKTQPTHVIVPPLNMQQKEDSHLVATIRGLNSTLNQKEKIIMKMTRDLDETKRLLSKLQKDKEINLKAHSVERIGNRRQEKKPSNGKQIVKTTETPNNNSNKENEIKMSAVDSVLQKDFINLQNDYENLKKKRIEDLYALQTAHEKELKNLNIKVSPLQQDVDSLSATVEILKNQIKQMDDQMSLLIIERDHLKSKVELLQSKLKYSTECDSDRSRSSGKGNERDYNYLKLKVAELEKRYEGRELRLKTLVDSLAKLKDSQLSVSGINSAHTTSRSAHISRPFIPF